MGTGTKIGIGVGASVGVIFLIIFTFYVTQYEDARLAQILAQYDEDTDRLIVAILLTDSNGDYTKASGDAVVTVKEEGFTVYSSDPYYFDKNDFISWQDNFGSKSTGYRIDIRQFFSSGSHDVFVDLNTKSSYWEDLHASFYSLESEPIQQQVPALESEPIQQQVPALESEPIQQQVPAPGFEDVPEMIVESENNCDPSYPDVCIPTYPPDLDCGEISYKKFKVLQPDPHGFDGDKDGIGCES